jgi:hypothetical protein
MPPAHTAKPAAAATANGPCKNDRPTGATSLPDSIEKLKAQHGRLIDRYGHEYSEAIFRNWSHAAIKAMGVRRVVAGKK